MTGQATCPYCDLPHRGDRCPTLLGQMVRLQEAWGRFTGEVMAPVERIARDPVRARIAWTGVIAALLMLTVFLGPRVLVLAAFAALLGLSKRR